MTPPLPRRLVDKFAVLLGDEQNTTIPGGYCLAFKETCYEHYAVIEVYAAPPGQSDLTRVLTWFTAWNPAGAEDCWTSLRLAAEQYRLQFKAGDDLDYVLWLRSLTEPLPHPPCDTPWCVEITLPYMERHSLALESDLSGVVQLVVWAQLERAGFDIATLANEDAY